MSSETSTSDRIRQALTDFGKGFSCAPGAYAERFGRDRCPVFIGDMVEIIEDLVE